MDKNIKKVTTKEIWDYITDVLDLRVGDKIRVRKEYSAYDDGVTEPETKFFDKYFVVGDKFLKGEYQRKDDAKFVRMTYDYFNYTELLDVEVTKVEKTKEEVVDEISSAINAHNERWEVDWSDTKLRGFLAWNHTVKNATILTTTNSEVPGAIYLDTRGGTDLIKRFPPREWAIYLGVEYN